MIAKIVPERAGLTAYQTRDVYYEYDLRGLQTAAWFEGSANDVTRTWYDAFGRPVTLFSQMSGHPRTIRHEYDRDGALTKVIHPDGQPFDYYHDGLGRLQYLYRNYGPQLARFTWRPSGLPEYLARNGSITTYIQDGAGRLERLIQDLAGAGSDEDLRFAYNPASQIASRASSNDSYAWRGAVAVNRPYSVNGQNQYTAAGAATFSYDSNGNLTSDGSTTFTYDVENRLVGVSGARSATLAYDPLGRLSDVTGASGLTRFLYDGDELIAEHDGWGRLLRRYVHGSGTDDPLVWYEGADFSQPRFLHTDHQGSITAISNDVGATLSINTYDEYGIPGANNQGRFQYTGQAWIPELGLYYYKARIYSPTLGRFLQVDPIGYDDQINLYAYVGNDPVNGRDPTGEMEEKERGLLERAGDVAATAASATERVATKTGEMVGKALEAASNAPGNAYRNARDGVASIGSILSPEKTTLVGRWMSPSEADKMIDTGMVQEPNNGTGQSYVAVPASSATFAKEAPKGSVYATYQVPSNSLRPSSTGRMFIAGPSSITSRNEVRQGRPALTMPKAKFFTIIKSK